MTATLTSLLKDPSEDKPALASGEVSSHWKLLKSLINTDEDNGKHVKGIDVDKYPKIISHGIHHQGKVNIESAKEQTLEFVAFNSLLDCYATLNNKGKITVVSSNGKTKRIRSDECFKGIVFSTKSKQCICWGNSDKLKVVFCSDYMLAHISWIYKFSWVGRIGDEALFKGFQN